MTKHYFKLIFTILLIVSFSSCRYDKPEAIALAEKELPEVVDYNFDVRPILSDKCFACHGPDAANQKADLRLDTAEDAYKALASGNGKGIVPGNPGKSEVYLRMISDDPEAIMPPPDSHLSLTDKEIATITKWIEQGAEYKPHWAFVPPEKANPPKVKNAAWSKNPIDAFVLNKLQKNALEPSKEASKETLIRRVYFDLTGLPPTLEEIDAFINDKSSNAYEKVVNQLLSSKAYGERMAANWMDVARYADSDGYLDDKHREMHPWRDWVIEAFNTNMPYDQFITWQIAGDQLPNTTKESTLATAFNRMHKRNSEAGIVLEEYRVEYVADRTNTLGTGVLGLSMECARCHDHKYDPISQKDYFQLFAFFNSTNELGTPVYGPDQVPGPSLLLSTPEEDLKIDQLKEMIERLEEQNKELASSESTSRSFENWMKGNLNLQNIKKGIQQSLTAHYGFDDIQPTKNDKVFNSHSSNSNELPAKLIEPIIRDGFKGKALEVSDYNSIQLGKKIGWYDRTDPFSFQMYIKPDTIYPDVGLMWHAEELRLGSKGYSLHLKDNKVQFIMARTWPQNAIQVTTKNTVAPKQWNQITVTYDGTSKADGVAIYLDGEKQEVTKDIDNLYKSILFEPDIHTYGFQGITMASRAKYIPFKKGLIDEFSVYDRELSALEVLLTHNEKKAQTTINYKNDNLNLLKNHYTLVEDDVAKSKREALLAKKEEKNQLVTNIKEIMVMGDLAEPRPTYVLDRGNYDSPAEEVEPSTPKSVLAFDENLPKNRYGLTQWLFDDNNPLTARVYVNRIWQMYFGQGIVKTSDDFGAQGSLPTHPELLDYLAVSFRESGWDIKQLHKTIVTSATYKQQSVITKELLEKDPENLLLARGPRYRLPAEMIRDNALAVSGLLVAKQGGESVYPYQPEGLWDGLTTKHWAYKYLQKEGDGLYRRTLYSFWKRASPPPFMQIFDVGNRGTCEVNRRQSSTPLQALNLLNDPQFVEASRVLAENLIKTENDSTKRLKKAFRILTGRKPDSKEAQMLTEFYQEELEHFSNNRDRALDFMKNGEKDWDKNLETTEIAALGVVVNSIMNTTEAYTKK